MRNKTIRSTHIIAMSRTQLKQKQKQKSQLIRKLGPNLKKIDQVHKNRDDPDVGISIQGF